MSRDAYGRAYEHGYHLTLRLLLSRGVAPETAHEVAQAAWVRGWERVDQLRSEARVVNWVNTIALNLYRSLLRQPAFEELPELRAPSGVNFAALDVQLILKICGPSERALLRQQIGGITVDGVAREKGLSPTAVRIRWLRARRMARVRVERRWHRLQPVSHA